MNKKIVAFSLLLAGVAGLGFNSASAYRGDPNIEGPNYSSERHEAITNAFETKDYNAWKEAKGDNGNGRMMEVINDDEKFAKFIEIRSLRLAGETEKADALRAELGLGQGRGNSDNMKRGMNGDYDGQKQGTRRNAERN